MSEKEILEIKKLKGEIRAQYISIAAIFAAGLWAFLTFDSLREAYLAEAKVAEYESKNVSLELNTELQELGYHENGKIAVEVVVSIKNSGLLPVDVDLNASETFTLSHVKNGFYSNEGEEKVNNLETLPVGKVYSSKAFNRITQKIIRSKTSISVSPETTQEVSYLLFLDEPGVYLSSFISEIPTDVLAKIELREVGDKNEKVTNKSAWMSQRYFRVNGEMSKKPN